MVIGSWVGVFSTTVGWIGFGVAGIASLGSYALAAASGRMPRDYVILDSRLLATKGESYEQAIELFKNGGTLLFDGVAFALRPENEIACGIDADHGDIDNATALELAEYAQSVFEKLSAASPEFHSEVSGRAFSVAICWGEKTASYEICRVVDGKVNWLK